MFLLSNVNTLLSAVFVAAATALGVPSIPVNGFDVQWLVALLFAGLITLNAFFIRKAAKTFDVVVQKVIDHDEDIVTLQQISEIVLTDMLVESAGKPEIGRRKNDAVLRIMLDRLSHRKRRSLPKEIAINE